MNILIITQHLFPIKTPRAHRTTELVKELARQGHTVVVYAVLGKHDYSSFEAECGVKVKPIPIRFQLIPYTSDGDGRRAFIDKVLERLLGRILEFPYIEFLFNISQIIKKEQGFDAIISIAAPHHIHWGCARAKQKNPAKFPAVWIADSGDPFMNNGKTKDHFSFFAKYEHHFCDFCNYISVPAQNAINGYYEQYHPKIKVIPQGFWFNLPISSQEPNNTVVTFAFAGIFYKDIRNPKQFLDYLITLPQNFRFVVYTPYQELLLEYIKPLGEKLSIKSPIDRLDLLEQLAKMDFLLNIENANSPNQTPSKLIDYALTGRPILSINPQKLETQVVDQFLRKDYRKQFIVENIENYHITNIANKFVDLITAHI